MIEETANNSKTSKAVRLVDYLLKLANLRTKLIRDLTDYEKVLWLSDIPHERGCFTQAWGRDEEHEPDEWLEVQNRREPDLPSVPTQCRDWVEPLSLRKKSELPELLPEITRKTLNPDWQEGSDQPETITHTEHIDAHPDLQSTWQNYIEEKWFPWSKEHSAWERVNKVYSAIFAIYQEQVRLGEEYELVLGLGLLIWKTPTSQRVCRHLIVADATLDFETRLGRFTVRPHTEGAKLRPELDMLDIGEQPVRAEQTAKKVLSATADDPWDRGCVEGALQSLVHSINSHGEYEASLEAGNIRASDKPIVVYAPALILRKRSTKGLTETLKRIKEQVEKGEEIPREFADLAEVRTKNDPSQIEEPSNPTAEFDGEIFFPKPSNEEQRGIVDKIRAASGVLVQGPPGTGKSHTIANLICHLLATGHRTLITAKTPRALQALEKLVPEQLRPLCISLLGSGPDERISLETSVSGILRKNDDWNGNKTKLDLIEVEKRLRNLREEKVEVERRLRYIREAETHTQSVAGGAYLGTAARIAEAVAHARASFDWFSDSVSLEETCPISTNDMRSVLTGLRQFTDEKREDLRLLWPKAEFLPTPDKLDFLFRDLSEAEADEKRSSFKASEIVAKNCLKYKSEDLDAISTLFSEFQNKVRRIREAPYCWTKDSLEDVYRGNAILWHELQRVTRDIILAIEDLVTIADETQVEFPDNTSIRSLHEDANKLKVHMEAGGRLGWGIFRPKLVKERLHVIKTVKIGGLECSKVEHFADLANVISVRINCERAWNYWEGRCQKSEGTYTLQLATLKTLRDYLDQVLSVEKLISKCQQALEKCPDVGEPQWSNESQVERIAASCRLAVARFRKRLALEAINRIEAPISSMAASSGNHPVTGELQSAIRNRDVNQFAICLMRIEELDNKKQALREADEHLSFIRKKLPKLTKQIELTCGELYWEDRVQRIGEAWRWAQARFWLNNFICQEDVPALIERAKQIQDQINNTIADLASLHAWSFCFSRLNESQRRSMKAWRMNFQSITQSGTGKQDYFHRREAQKNLNNCREAIPAWVMPLHRVWDTVAPKPAMFDVIIVDEASQCGPESLALLFMAKKILVVGDDKQISPEAVGVKKDEITQLIEQYLYDYEHKAYFNIDKSLFHHAYLRFSSGCIVLREHFRCMPEIIRFSNDLSYSDTPLIPLRQYGPNRLPPLEHVFVRDGYREGSNSRTINRPEAEAIVERIVKMCKDSRYVGKTMGVVVLQGEAQASEIENQLLKQIGAEEIQRRRLVCGNPYSFQGDERDIILLSLVAANNERIGPLTKEPDKRRFNVAASRARDQMILFHSVTCDELSPECFRRKLLEFFSNTMTQDVAGFDTNTLERRAHHDNRTILRPPTPFDSWFEIDVALELIHKKYKVLPQYKVAGGRHERIDLVIEGGMARLAVECDGDFWHGAERYEADMNRQRELERCGWQFFRVRESAFYSNKENALKGLWVLLKGLGIFPYYINDKNILSENVIEDADGNNNGH